MLLDVAPVQREILEAAHHLAAVAVLFYVSFWLISRARPSPLDGVRDAKVWAAATTGATLALAGVGFTAVYREGFETALIYQALFDVRQGLTGWVVLGCPLRRELDGGRVRDLPGRRRKLPVRTFLPSP